MAKKGAQFGIVIGFFSSIVYLIIAIAVAILHGTISAPWVFEGETPLSLLQWAIQTFSGAGLILTIACAVTGLIFGNNLTIAKDIPSRKQFTSASIKFCGWIVSPMFIFSIMFIFYPILSGFVSVFHPRVLEVFVWPVLPSIIYFLDGILISNYLYSYSQMQFELTNDTFSAS